MYIVYESTIDGEYIFPDLFATYEEALAFVKGKDDVVIEGDACETNTWSKNGCIVGNVNEYEIAYYVKKLVN